MVCNLALLLPCTICLFGATWLICKRENNTHSQNLLVVRFLISALFFICKANYVTGYNDSTTYMWWDIIDSFAAMLAIPTMYLYFHSTIQERKFTWKEYIWFVPALVVGTSTARLYMAIDKAEMKGYIQSVLIEEYKNGNYSESIYKLHQFIGVEIYNLTALFQIVGASIFTILRVKKYHKRLRDFYSDADDKSIYVDKILYWCLSTIPLSLALIAPDIKFWKEHPAYSSLLFIAWALVYFALFYYGSQKEHTVDHFVQDLQQADLAEKSYCEMIIEKSEEANVGSKKTPDRQMSSEVFQRLEKLFTELIDEKKVYLKKDLRLDEVARLMFTNQAYVSKVVKEKYHCSFSDYINRKRIDYSMDFMLLEPNLTQDKIAKKQDS